MIAFPKEPEGDEDDERAGGQGGPVYLEPDSGQTSDTRLLERAVRERWKIPDEYRDGIVERQVRIATDPEASSREATAAARCIVSMEAQNQADEHKFIDKNVPDLAAMSGIIEHRHTVPELLATPEYVEWLRERERNSESSPVCPNGHAGNGHAVANGSARNGHRP